MAKMTKETLERLRKLQKMSANELTDELGEYRQQKKEAETEEGLIKTVLKTKLKDVNINLAEQVLEGKKYELNVSTTSRRSLNAEKVKQFLTEEQLEQCYNTTEVTTYRTMKKADAD